VKGWPVVAGENTIPPTELLGAENVIDLTVVPFPPTTADSVELGIVPADQLLPVSQSPVEPNQLSRPCAVAKPEVNSKKLAASAPRPLARRSKTAAAFRGICLRLRRESLASMHAASGRFFWQIRRKENEKVSPVSGVLVLTP
jgi:hypothetical protein